eukprot:365686-Chlamydomonas_euryale.AAC.2
MDPHGTAPSRAAMHVSAWYHAVVHLAWVSIVLHNMAPHDMALHGMVRHDVAPRDMPPHCMAHTSWFTRHGPHDTHALCRPGSIHAD